MEKMINESDEKSFSVKVCMIAFELALDYARDSFKCMKKSFKAMKVMCHKCPFFKILCPLRANNDSVSVNVVIIIFYIFFFVRVMMTPKSFNVPSWLFLNFWKRVKSARSVVRNKFDQPQLFTLLGLYIQHL